MVRETALAVVVMGVSGCGKSTLGRRVAEAVGSPFLEGDEFHPDSNVEKMRGGVPLTDQDRWPWLERLGLALGQSARDGGIAVAACSALRHAYRDLLRERAGVPLLFVCLRTGADLVAERVAARPGHFMPASLVDSQLATLELPDATEWALLLQADQPVEDLLGSVLAALPR